MVLALHDATNNASPDALPLHHNGRNDDDADSHVRAGNLHMKPLDAPPARNGFTIIEVMVALVVISIGLLGIAKMQALALASTSTSRLRSLAAIQAASLGSAMHANRAYWAAATLTQPIAVSRRGNVDELRLSSDCGAHGRDRRGYGLLHA